MGMDRNGPEGIRFPTSELQHVKKVSRNSDSSPRTIHGIGDTLMPWKDWQVFELVLLSGLAIPRQCHSNGTGCAANLSSLGVLEKEQDWLTSL